MQVMWTIYDHPRDYPNHFVLRRQLIFPGVIIHDEHCHLTRTLGEARKLVPLGRVRVPRAPEDDVFIVETWE